MNLYIKRITSNGIIVLDLDTNVNYLVNLKDRTVKSDTVYFFDDYDPDTDQKIIETVETLLKK